MKRIAGIHVILLDDSDQSLGGMSYAAGEVLKIDVSGDDLTGLAMTISATASGDPVDEYEPTATDEDGVAQFRIPDSDIGEWIAEGETAYVNFWTGTEDDDRRRAYGTVKRKVSIRRLTAAPAVATWDDSETWNDSGTWTEAA